MSPNLIEYCEVIPWRFVSPMRRRRFATGMTYVAVVTPPKFRVTWGRLQGLVDFIKNEQRQLWVRPMGGWNSTLPAAWYVRQAHWACWCYVPFVIWCLWITSTIWLLIAQFHKFYGTPFARILYLFLMKYIGRWLPWMPPESTGRFYKDDAVRNYSAHGYYIPA